MNPRLLSRTALVAALGLALAAPAAFAQAQSASPPQQAPTQATAPADAGPPPSDTELQHFAKAVVQVQTIRNSLQPELASAQTDGARTQIKQNAEKQMESAVRSNDLSLTRYVQIANVVQTDPAVRTKVQQMMPPKPQTGSPQS